MNNFFKILRLSLGATIETFRHNISRSVLTMFGIMVGITMVILVLSAGAGVKGIILDEVSSFGNNWINTEVKVPETAKNSQENSRAIAQGVSITTLTDADAKEITKLSNIIDAYAGVTTQVVISYQQEKTRPTVFGVTPSYTKIDKSQVAQGRFFTEDENNGAEQVVVLGHEIKNNLFGDSNAVGKQVKVNSRAYRVIGVMEELGASGFFNKDTLIYIPLKTVQKKIMGIEHVLFIISETKDNTLAESTAEEIRWLLRERHGIKDEKKDDFAVTTMSEALELVGTIVKGITWLLIALASISLLVGGVGIMNVMYVSVVERTFEIGLRRAVGASKKYILWQFLIESVCLTLLGGLGGMMFGGTVSFVIALVAQSLGYAWTFSLSVFSIVLSVGFCTAVGVLFGLYPARRASEISPIEALRQE